MDIIEIDLVYYFDYSNMSDDIKISGVVLDTTNSTAYSGDIEWIKEINHNNYVIDGVAIHVKSNGEIRTFKGNSYLQKLKNLKKQIQNGDCSILGYATEEQEIKKLLH